MKDAVLTIRIPSSLRERVEDLARREGRSLSQQAGRLIEQGMSGHGRNAAAPDRAQPRPLEGLLAGGQVPTLADFRTARALINRSLAAGKRSPAAARR